MVKREQMQFLPMFLIIETFILFMTSAELGMKLLTSSETLYLAGLSSKTLLCGWLIYRLVRLDAGKYKISPWICGVLLGVFSVGVDIAIAHQLGFGTLP
jgi:hypothetical protein